MIKFKACGYEVEIEKVECERETDSTVWIGGRRYGKNTSYGCFFDSFDEAKAHLMEKAENEFNKYKICLDHAKDRYQNVKGLKLKE